MHKRYLWSLFVILALLVTACGSPEVPAAEAPAAEAPAAEAPAAEAPAAEAPAAEAPAAEVPAGQYSEAPMLAEIVAAGDLPPVDDRLPQDPFVVGPGVLIAESDLPDWTPGQYGGTLRSAHSVANWSPDIFVMMNEPLLSSPGIGVDDIRGNVLKDFEVSDDNRVFTFYMREGLKWSDGEPVTSEDVRFVYEDILLNEQISPAFPLRFRTGFRADGDPMSLEIVDDYTFRISFPEPYGGFLRAITIEGWVGYTELLRPSHYLKQFHPTYTPMEELQPLMEEQNLTDEWWNLFNIKNCNNWDMTNPRCVNYPALNPWIGVEAQTGVLSFERNPYYYKVDTQGQQLPYLDKVVSVQVEDVEMVNLRVLTGDVDFLRESTGLVKVPLYKENEEQAGFRTVLLDMHVDSSGLRLNQTFDDPVWREVVRDIRFRQAVSLAANRDELIESIYYGFASLPLKTVGEDLAVRDLDRANALLDEMGMTERDGDGFRLAPGGEPFSIMIEHGGHAPDISPVSELVVEHLADVGIRATTRQIDPQLFGQRDTANELMGSVMWSHDVGWGADNTTGNIARAGRLWELWRTSNGAEGEEPTDWIKEVIELAAQTWNAVPGTPEYEQLREQSYAWERANLPMINFVEQVKYPMIASQRLGNMPQAGYAIAANFSGEQLFFQE